VHGYRGLIAETRAKDCKAKVRLPDLNSGKGTEGLLTDWLPVCQIWTHGARAFHMPRPGQQCYVFFLDDDHADGVVMGGRYSDVDTPDGEIGPDDLYYCLEDGGRIRLAPGFVDIYTPGSEGNEAAVTVQAGGNICVDSTKVVGIQGEAGIVLTTQGEVVVNAGMAVSIDTPHPVTVKGDAIALGAAEKVTIEANSVVIKAKGQVAIEAPAVKVTGAITVSGTVTAADFVSTAGKTLLLHVHTAGAPGSPTTPPV
jgi:phage baseplate assembly protein V